ncbi:MAG: hypothetical protein J5617_03680 [Bacilli bacterium]|nr:hypothetical protein [Bacilli bacterium]
MDNTKYLFKKVRNLDRDMDHIYELTRKNAGVFNQFSGEVKRRLTKMEKSNRKWHFVVFGLLLEDISLRFKIREKMKKYTSFEEENFDENEENS